LIRVLRNRLWYASKYWLRQRRLTTRLGIGPVARRVFDAGVDIPASTLKVWGLTPSAEGYGPSRSCVKP
jgi:hypothetical protein